MVSYNYFSKNIFTEPIKSRAETQKKIPTKNSKSDM